MQGTILRSRYLDVPQAYERTISACEDLLEASQSRQIQKAYDLGADDPHPGMLKLISELRFYLPAVAAAKGLRFPRSLQVQEYHMDQVSQLTPRLKCQSLVSALIDFHRQTNPFEGAYHGLSSHTLDLGYLLRNLDP